MRIVSLAIASLIMFGTAQAATVSVANGDFEAEFVLPEGDAKGDYAFDAAGWTSSGIAGTWEFNPTLFTNPPSSLGDRIGYASAGYSLSQLLNITITESTDYTLSALFGNRLDLTNGYGGSFGFFAGDPSNIIGTLQAIVNPGEGLFSEQSTTVLASALSQYVGLGLGIIFIGESGQINFDNIQVSAIGETLENPLPAAVWLFGSALAAAGGFASRRRKVKFVA